jgi:PAS domain S-box-containing protein
MNRAGSKLNLLLVENNTSEARIIEEMIRDNTALNLIYADCLHSAIELLKQDNIDVILLDLTLPDSMGLDTVSKIVALKPLLPVIVLAGTEDNILARNAIKTGAQDYLVKNQIDSSLLSRSIFYSIERAGLLRTIQKELGQYKKAEKASFKSEHNFSSTLDNMMEGCQIIDKDWNYIYINDAAEIHNRRPKEELIGRKYMDMWPGIEETEVFNRIRRCMQERIAQQMENEFVFPDGIRGWFDLRIQPVPEGVFILSIDITERKQIEAGQEITVQLLNLMNSLANLRELIREVTLLLKNWTGIEAIGIRLRDGDDFPYFETRGFPSEFVRMENSLCVYNSDGKPICDTDDNPILECMCGNVLRGRFNPEKPFFTKRGSFWTNCTTELLATTTEEDRQARTRNRCNGEGYESVALIPIRTNNIVYGLIQLNDRHKGQLTAQLILLMEHLADNLANTVAQRLTDEVLRVSEERYRTVADYTYSWEYWRAPDGKILYMSPSCERITGYKIREFIENPDLMEKIVYPDDHFIFKQHKLSTQQEVNEQGVHKADFRILRRNGEVRWIGHCCQIIRRSDGTSLGRRATNRDINDRKQAEEKVRKLNEELEKRVIERTAQLEAANKELEAFSYSVSHDLRAPLRAIDGFTRILLENHSEQLTNEGKRVSKVICDNTKHMGQLIDDMLAFSRIGRTGLQMSPIDMKTMAESVFIELTTPEMHQRINFKLGDLAPAYGDLSMIRQVWMNLISNAIKFSSKRKSAIISIEQNRLDDKIVYCITDNGAGFDNKYADKLFGVFQRLHSSSKFEGTGVGLAIVKRIIHRHGGKLWAEGAVDKGASFFFSIPNNKI